jgi:four helix bundle protein
MYENFIAFQKTYNFVLYLIPILNRFPKSQRFTLAQEIEISVLGVLRALREGVNANGAERLGEWRKASRTLDDLRILIRLAKDARFLSIKQYGTCAEKMNEIGKLTGGLIHSSSSHQVIAIQAQVGGNMNT